jgi:K+-sensing histidine kinase KdpD
MHQTASNLFILLKNLLEWGQMQNGSMRFQPKISSLSDLIVKNVETLKERSDQRG